MKLETLKSFLRPGREDLEIICLDGDKILLHRIFLGFLSEFWADLLLEDDVQSEHITTIFVPSDGSKIREALGNVNENPDAFVDTLFGKITLEQKYEIEPIPLSNDASETIEPGYIGDCFSNLQEEKPNMKRKYLEEETKEICEICNRNFFSKSIEAHKIWHARKKAEKEQKKEHKKQRKNERLERKNHEEVRKREQAEIKRKEREKEKSIIREQTRCEIYTCESCGKTFANDILLQKHFDRMHGEPMKCAECDFKTRYIRTIRTHMRHHEGKIHETCHVCGAKFLSRLYLRKHMQIHENREKATCPEPSCGKSVLALNLKQHLKIHRQERKLKCEDCDYKARDGFNLKLHRGKMHDDNPLIKEQCSHCEVKTMSMSNHIKSFHPDIYWNFKDQKKSSKQMEL